MWTPAKIHPKAAANREQNRDSLRRRKRAQKTVVLGAYELDDEPLDPREHAVQPEQPALRVLMIAETPENQKHHEAERDFVELRRVDGEDLVRRRAQWRHNVKELRHVG